MLGRPIWRSLHFELVYCCVLGGLPTSEDARTISVPSTGGIVQQLPIVINLPPKYAGSSLKSFWILSRRAIPVLQRFPSPIFGSPILTTTRNTHIPLIKVRYTQNCLGLSHLQLTYSTQSSFFFSYRLSIRLPLICNERNCWKLSEKVYSVCRWIVSRSSFTPQGLGIMSVPSSQFFCFHLHLFNGRPILRSVLIDHSRYSCSSIKMLPPSPSSFLYKSVNTIYSIPLLCQHSVSYLFLCNP